MIFSFFNFFDFTYYLFYFLLLSPLLVIIFLTAVPRYNITVLRYFSFVSSLLIFIISCVLYFMFDVKNSTFQFITSKVWIFNLNFSFGVDGISIFFIILTAFLIPLCIVSSWENIKFRLREFYILLFLVEFFLFFAFTVLDIVMFYIFFEAVLIPMFVMIGVWGSRSRKIHASYQFFIYTFFGSVFMLLAILFIFVFAGTTDYISLMRVEFCSEIQNILWLAFFISFAIKIPMVPVHIWLPEAHVEAPTAGSVLLAGILLKLGTYGLLRFLLPLFPLASKFFTPLVLTMSIIAIIYTSCTTLRQIDLKKIIAYSSVAHMNLVTVGIFSNSLVGIEGSLFLMLSHGVVSPALFLCVGVLYDRYKTRLIYYYSGLISLMPRFGFYFLVFTLANMGFPGTSSFIGEFLIMMGAFNNNNFVAVVSALSVIFSAAYSVWLYNRVMFGPLSDVYIHSYSDTVKNSREDFFLAALTALVILLGIFPNKILDVFHFSSTNILLSTYNWVF